MKLVLANNQSNRFVQFHADLQKNEKVYDYSGYTSLIFYFEKNVTTFTDIKSGKSSGDYSGVYINGYADTPEVAFTVATVLDHAGIPYVNTELRNAPSLTKLSGYAKLAAGDVDIPKTYAGTADGLLGALDAAFFKNFPLPVVIKRADADRGVDNFIFDNYDEVRLVLEKSSGTSLWLIQEFLPNDGFYLTAISHQEPSYGIFRSLKDRPDHRKELAHMFKPRGGSNARFMNPDEIPPEVVAESLKAVKVMRREISSVDAIFDEETGRVCVLEVNYNPQLVTASVFNEYRNDVFIRAIKTIE